jgi:long-chain acyl-CoA synthetase
VRRGDHVVLLLRNRPEFYLADTACMLLGAIPVSAYLSPAIDPLAQVIADCEAVACVAEHAVFLDRVRAAVKRVGTRRPRLIGVDHDTAARDVTAFADIGRGQELDVAAAAAAARPGDTVTMLYTSGTTGKPKGVPLTHVNLLFAARTLSQRMGVPLTGRRQLSYLPMAHIGERLATHYLHMVQGSTVTCCPDLQEFPATLQATSPHMLFGAPRMWERLYESVTARLDGEPELRSKASQPQLRPAERRAVLHDVLAEFGLADIAVAIVGSAPLPRHVQQFWLDTGFPLADCYGQTETCGMGTWDPRDIVLGTCGKPFDGMRISVTADGEILLRGPAVFGGYYRNPDATARVIDADGWYHTGDLGQRDDGGNLVLAGRRDDVIVPTSGHSVNPGPLEQKLSRIPCVGHAMVAGHGRPYLTALLALDPQAAEAWAAEHGKAGASLAELAADPRLRALADGAVTAVNEELPGAERIRQHTLVPDPWPLASDLLTATGKMRRAGIARRYADVIDGMYDKKPT